MNTVAIDATANGGNVSSGAHWIAKASLHGHVQGTFSAMTGGDYITTFVTSAVSSSTGSLLEPLKNESLLGYILFNSTIGGVTEEIMGGDFWQGFTTAAMITGLNHCGDQIVIMFESEKPQLGSTPINPSHYSDDKLIDAILNRIAYLQVNNIEVTDISQVIELQGENGRLNSNEALLGLFELTDSKGTKHTFSIFTQNRGSDLSTEVMYDKKPNSKATIGKFGSTSFKMEINEALKFISYGHKIPLGYTVRGYEMNTLLRMETYNIQGYNALVERYNTILRWHIKNK